MPRNLRKIPQSLIDRIRVFDVDDVVAACAKRLKIEDIKNYDHLGLKLLDGNLIVPATQIPPVRSGRYSKANVEGHEVKRYDLPMIPKTRSWETPNWGDPSRGYHTTSITRQVYQRDGFPPKQLKLSISLIEEHDNPKQYVFKFAIEQLLNRRAPNFESNLLYNLNVLQENVGAAEVFSSTATLADYIATVTVEWEILPPGKLDDIVRKMLQGKGPVSDKDRERMTNRLEVLSRFNPQVYIKGTKGFDGYFGAKFDDDLVVFENLRYGNALYIMYENWVTLSQRSRTELLRGPKERFDRILHTSQWERNLEDLLNERRKTV